MHTEIGFLKDIVIIFALASFVIWLFHKLRVPSIIGFLLTGILTGPFAFGLVKSVDEIEVLAEIGVVLLLFTIGIEFSLKSLVRIRKLVFLGGFLQVLFTTLFTGLISYFFGRSLNQSLFIGFLAALSSTAVVLKILQERAEISEDYGKFSVGVLIFQDLVIVPMILVVPLLSGHSTDPLRDILLMVGKLIAVGVLTIAGAKYFVPWMLHQVARTRSQELFLLSVLMLGLAVAVITSSLGLSLALGAFLAGLTISESEYSHQAFGNIIPVRDIFISFFFVSIGMLFNVGYVADHLVQVLVVAIIVLVVKTVISGFVAFLLGFPFRTTVLAGLALSQVGEFSFILARFGMDFSLIDDNFYRLFIAVSVLTMALAPFVIMMAPNLARMLGRLPLPPRLENGLNPPVYDKISPYHKHLVIIGMGLHGKNVARAARLAGIKYLVIDNDPDLVREARNASEPVYFGDAVHPPVLEQAHIADAMVVVITPSHSATVYSLTALVREMNSHAHILVRARQLKDIEDLYHLGASEVNPKNLRPR
ncbi:MAG TPA: cation:proton antiporter [Bacteroidales bacterium]|nr:cation:proton antiporter [Bacteroidales bacterium]